jgi:hypothetical protein
LTLRRLCCRAPRTVMWVIAIGYGAGFVREVRGDGAKSLEYGKVALE